MDNVSPLVAPVPNDTLATELSSDHLLEVIVTVATVAKLLDLLQTSRGAHELKDRVYGESAAKLSLES